MGFLFYSVKFVVYASIPEAAFSLTIWVLLHPNAAGSPKAIGAERRLYSVYNMPTPALFRSGYTRPEATIKLNIALDHILRRVASGPKICP